MEDATLDIRNCHATACRFNEECNCLFRAVEIGVDGRCIHFEERTPEFLRTYLERRGVPLPEIERILQEAQK